MTIGSNLKKLRTARGLTQDQLAEVLHVTRQAVSGWERGRTHPDLDQLEAIAAALGVEVTTLLYGPPKSHRPSRKRVGVTIGVLAAALLATVLGYEKLEPWLAGQLERTYELYYRQLEVLYFGPFQGLLWGMAAMALVSWRWKVCLGKTARRWCLAGGILALLATPLLFQGTLSSWPLMLFWTSGWQGVTLLAGLAAGALLFLAANPPGKS